MTRAAQPVAVAVAQLVRAIDADPWGSVGPSVYETARVCAFAPGLPGRHQRLRHLLTSQRKDGSWGDGTWAFRLVSTLGCVDALLTVIAEQRAGWLGPTAAAGLAALRAGPPSVATPDTAAVELVVPDLVLRINRLLARPELRTFGGPLTVPRPYSAARLTRVRDHLGGLPSLPVKFHHTFEVVAGYVAAPAIAGLLGSSPAATAAADAARRELRVVGRRYGSLFPEVAPISVVERLWVLSALARIGLPGHVRSIATRWIEDIHDPDGVRGAPGLDVDADDTAMALHVAAAYGTPRDPAVLRTFEAAERFACYVGEDTGSATANAHVLHALASYLHQRPDRRPAHAGAVKKACTWLLDHQAPDGHWTDKWHASPYYATAHTVAALAAHGDPASGPAIARAADWVRATQRVDGGWGHWTSTAEETAYAAQILLTERVPADAPLRRALDVLEAVDADHPHQPLWKDKTLYAPNTIIAAEVLVTRAQLARCIGAGDEQRLFVQPGS